MAVVWGQAAGIVAANIAATARVVALTSLLPGTPINMDRMFAQPDRGCVSVQAEAWAGMPKLHYCAAGRLMDAALAFSG